MEETGVKLIVSIIISVIVLIVLLSIAFIVMKFKNDAKRNTPETTTAPLNLKTLSCFKVSDMDILKREDITITYSNDELYQYDVIYTYKYKNALKRDETLSTLRTIMSNEQVLFHEGISTSFKEIDGGGELTIKYDLTQQNVRMYVNDKYFYKNIYLKDKELINYLYANNYVCETSLT